MPTTGDSKSRSKAKENTTRITRRNKIVETALGNKNPDDKQDHNQEMTEAHEMENERDKMLLEKMNEMMKATMSDAMADMKKLIASEIASLSLTNDESISKLRTEMTSKFKTLENRLGGQKTTMDKVTKIEKTVVQIQEVLSDETCENLNNLSDFAPRIQHLETKTEGQQESFDEITKSMEHTNEDLRLNKADIEALKEEVIGQRKIIDRLINDNRKTKAKFSNLYDLVNTLDNRQRKQNLIFEGINEEKKEDVRQVIEKLFTDAKIDLEKTAIVSAYRLGRKSTSKSRPILVSFSNTAVRDSCLLNASKIKKHSKITSLWINKDLSDVTRIKSMEVRKCYNLMKSKKLKCQLSGSTITFNDKTYEHKDLKKLPEGCRLEDTQLITCEDNISLCFQGSHAYTSNFYPIEIDYKDQLFTSAEQAFQWSKATFHKEWDIANKILDTDDPYAIKKIIEDGTASERWKQKEEEILHEIVKQKFMQNEKIYNRFVSSTHTAYYKCTTGNKWGCGSRLNAIDLDPEKLKGKNKFGEILNSLKQEFKRIESAKEQK